MGWTSPWVVFGRGKTDRWANRLSRNRSGTSAQWDGLPGGLCSDLVAPLAGLIVVIFFYFFTCPLVSCPFPRPFLCCFAHKLNKYEVDFVKVFCSA